MAGVPARCALAFVACVATAAPCPCRAQTETNIRVQVDVTGPEGSDCPDGETLSGTLDRTLGGERSHRDVAERIALSVAFSRLERGYQATLHEKHGPLRIISGPDFAPLAPRSPMRSWSRSPSWSMKPVHRHRQHRLRHRHRRRPPHPHRSPRLWRLRVSRSRWTNRVQRHRISLMAAWPVNDDWRWLHKAASASGFFRAPCPSAC